MWCCSPFASIDNDAAAEDSQGGDMFVTELVTDVSQDDVKDQLADTTEVSKEVASGGTEAPKVLLTQLRSCSSEMVKGDGVEHDTTKVVVQDENAGENEDKAVPDTELVADVPRVHSVISVDSKLSGTFRDAPGRRPAFSVPAGEKPNGTDVLLAVEMFAILEKLRSQNWLPMFLQENKKATEIAATPWTQCKQSPQVLVRRVTFTLPVPQDFPRAVTRLVNLVEQTKVTAIFRLVPQHEHVVLTIQMCSHDVPFGESFRVHETALFKPTTNGDTELTMWVEVMWTKSLPWTHGVLKSVIDQKSKADPMVGRIGRTLKSA